MDEGFGFISGFEYADSFVGRVGGSGTPKPGQKS